MFSPDSRKWMLAVAALTVVCFAPALGNAFLDWDDRGNLLDNPAWRGLSPAHLRWMLTSFHQGHWHPLTWLSFAIDDKIWGLSPFGFHLTNILLHAANAALVFALFTKLLPTLPARTACAAAGALLFSLHPLRVESVAWITERRDVLSTFFLLLALLAWLTCRERGGPRAVPRFYVFALAAFALSLSSKAWGITFPLILICLPSTPSPDASPKEVSHASFFLTPFAGLAIGAAYLAFRAQSETGAMAGFANHPLPARLAQASFGLVFYVWKTILPLDLSPLYPIGSGTVDPWALPWLASAALVAVVALALFALRRRFPFVVFAILAYAIVLSPVLGLVQTGPQLVADRYSYLATIPFAALAAAGLLALTSDPKRRRVFAIATFVVLSSLASLTARQTLVWRNSITLWNHALALDPSNTAAWVHRSETRFLRSDFDGAEADASEAIVRQPASATAWLARGVAKLGAGRARAAISDFDEALARSPGDPNALNNRGAARLAIGDPQGAIRDLDLAVAAMPRFAPGWLNRGRARHALGDLPGAEADFGHAITLQPANPLHWNNRANARASRGDLAGAVSDFNAAIRLDPAEPSYRLNRGRVRQAHGDREGAIRDYTEAISIAPPEWPLLPTAQRALDALLLP